MGKLDGNRTVWKNPDSGITFDNVGIAYIALFQVGETELVSFDSNDYFFRNIRFKMYKFCTNIFRLQHGKVGRLSWIMRLIPVLILVSNLFVRPTCTCTCILYFSSYLAGT